MPWLSRHCDLIIISKSEVKSDFLPNHWTKSYEPGVYCEVLDNAKKMAVESKDSAGKRASTSGIMIQDGGDFEKALECQIWIDTINEGSEQLNEVQNECAGVKTNGWCPKWLTWLCQDDTKNCSVQSSPDMINKQFQIPLETLLINRNLAITVFSFIITHVWYKEREHAPPPPHLTTTTCSRPTTTQSKSYDVSFFNFSSFFIQRARMHATTTHSTTYSRPTPKVSHIM